MAENTKLPTRPMLIVYPNPSTHAHLHIAYALPAANPVQLKVYDATGTLIRTLLDGTMPPGKHTITWDRLTNKGATAAPGIYFLKLRTGTTLLTEKVILQR
jgi:flagellar hook assembly protein FlgD